jgi:uncharacterized membrane protein YgcG
MATVINNPGERTNPSTDSGAGWSVAVVVLLAIVIGAVYLFSHYRTASTTPNANINVTLPEGQNGTPSGQNGSGNTGGSDQGGNTGGGNSSGGSGGANPAQ